MTSEAQIKASKLKALVLNLVVLLNLPGSWSRTLNTALPSKTSFINRQQTQADTLKAF